MDILDDEHLKLLAILDPKSPKLPPKMRVTIGAVPQLHTKSPEMFATTCTRRGRNCMSKHECESILYRFDSSFHVSGGNII